MNGEADASYRWVVLLTTTLGAFMTPLDGSIVSVALPSIAAALALSYLEVLWIPTAYLLCLASLLLSFGRLSDDRGRKQFFTVGFTIFTVASALCSLSQYGLQLIAFRAVQGVGAAMIGATSYAIVTETFPIEERGKVLGVNTMAVYTGLAVGPTLGGLLVQALGWRSIFYVNIPIGIVVILVAATRLREFPKGRALGISFDLSGASSFSAGLSLVLIGLTLGGGYRYTEPFTLGALVGGLGLLTLFILVEYRRGKDALLDPSFFRGNRLFVAANITALLDYSSYYAVTVFISFYLHRLMGYNPSEVGLILIAMPLPMVVLAPVSGWLSDRFGSRIFSSVGMALISAALFILSLLNLGSSVIHVVAGLLILGVGMGLFSTPNASAVMGSVKGKRLGVASGTLATMRFMGQSLSIAIMGAVAATIVPPEVLEALFGKTTGYGVLAVEAFIQGMSRAFSVGATLALIGVLTSMVRAKET